MVHFPSQVLWHSQGMSTEHDSSLRLLTMILESIVTTYASFIIDDAVEILKDVSLNDEDSILLWRQVILTLQRTFEHDQDGKIRSLR